MPRRYILLLDVAFGVAIALIFALDSLGSDFRRDERIHLFGVTVIMHSDQRIVIRDWSDRLRTFGWIQNIDLDWLENTLAIYAGLWLICGIWRLSVSLRPRRDRRGFDVIQKPKGSTRHEPPH